MESVSGLRIVASARQHGITDESIRHAFDNAIRVEDSGDGMTMVVGPGFAGNLVELGVVDGEDGRLVGHAMRARPRYWRRH